jgi:plastocyanin
MKLLKVLAGSICVGLLLFSYGQALAQGEAAPEGKVLAGHQVVQIHYSTGIKPDNLTVNRGTSVIWINQAMAPMQIKFTDKRITTACENPVNFIKDVDGSFISDKVPFGAVASLCFIEKGTYKYTAARDTRMVADVQKGKIESGKTFEGTIVVE